jgi:hypothetical protein
MASVEILIAKYESVAADARQSPKVRAAAKAHAAGYRKAWESKARAPVVPSPAAGWYEEWKKKCAS